MEYVSLFKTGYHEEHLFKKSRLQSNFMRDNTEMNMLWNLAKNITTEYYTVP